MGKPMPGWDVQILDEDERPVAQGERGEICLRARSNPHYPLGYWNNEEAGRETFGGEWFHTKDAASADEDGYVWYEGRADDVIIAAGYRIGPFEVESACLEHPAVARGGRGRLARRAARATSSRRSSSLAEGVEPSDELADEIKAFVRERLGAHAYPRRIEFTDDAAQDADGQDPADRAAPARARAPKRACVARACHPVPLGVQEPGIAPPPSPHRRPPALLPPATARLAGFAALALLGALQWQRMVDTLTWGDALLWVLVAVLAAVGILWADALEPLARRRPRSRVALASLARRLRHVRARAGAAQAAPDRRARPPASRTAPRRSPTCRCPTRARTRGRR